MKRTVMAAMLVSLLAGTAARANPPQDYHHDQHDQHHEDHHGDMHHGDMHHGDMHHGDMHRGDLHRGDMHHGDMHRGHFNSGHYERPHGWHAHSWRRGERLPPAYRGPGYVIPNATVYHLRPPPAGYYWVRVDNNAILAAVATGVVLDVAVNLFH